MGYVANNSFVAEIPLIQLPTREATDIENFFHFTWDQLNLN